MGRIEDERPVLAPSAFTGRVGVAREDITPPVGIYARNWGAAKHDTAESIHRPLTLTALTLASHAGDGPLVLVAADLGWWRALDSLFGAAERIARVPSAGRTLRHRRISGLADARRPGWAGNGHRRDGRSDRSDRWRRASKATGRRFARWMNPPCRSVRRGPCSGSASWRRPARSTNTSNSAEGSYGPLGGPFLLVCNPLRLTALRLYIDPAYDVPGRQSGNSPRTGTIFPTMR